MVIEFIDDHRARFGGVAPICRVLTEHGVQIAPQTYFAAKTRAPSPRSVRDQELAELITAVHADREKGRGVAGYRKVWHLLPRDGVDVASHPGCLTLSTTGAAVPSIMTVTA